MSIPQATVSEFKVVYTPAKSKDKTTLKDSKSSYDILKPFYKDIISYKEACYLLCLNNSNMVIGVHKLSEGGISASVVDIRLVFQAALLSHSTQIIISHNHPSGGLKPSNEDRRITQKIREAGNLLDIKLLDHIILTENSYFSFADEGIL